MSNKLERKYGLFTAICMVVGIVIGSGVFFKAQTILQKTGGNMPLGILAWLIGGAIMLVCLLEGAQKSSIFCVLAALFFVASGSAPGYYVLPVITVMAMVITMFRQGYLARSMGTIFVCLAVAVVGYEMTVFAIEYLSGNTLLGRINAFWLKALLSLAAAPLIYPFAAAIEKIGGETWKE